MNKFDDRKLKYIVTLAALFVALAHLIWPKLTIDSITLSLLFIALIPWLSPLFKSLKLPGGWEVQFQEVKEKVDTIVAKETEPVGSAFTMKALSVNDNATRSVLKALGDPRYTWRFIGGLKQDTKLSENEVLRSIAWLIDNDLVTESKVKDRRQWALTREGRALLSNVLRDEQNSKTT
jgi:hypothetical protein